MKYKCLPGDVGVDVSLNESSVFKFEARTHVITSLGGDRVRITRKIDGTHDIYNSPISNFVDLDGVPVATDFNSLVDYFTRSSISIIAGEGIAVDGKKVSVIAGGPSTLGGYKVGTGLMVDGSGKLSATASSEVTKVLSTEAEMLALVAEPLRPYRVIRLDTQKLYYLNAGASPAVVGNWFVGPSIEAAVVSFNGRTGAVDPEVGDYDQDMVLAIDKTTATSYKFVMDGGALFLEEIESGSRRPVSFLGPEVEFNARLTELNDIVTNEADGLVKRVVNLEARPLAKDFTNDIASLASKDIAQDTRIGLLDAQMLNKATLVDGKLPYDILPEIASGRKLNVANRAARLALKPYPDLTIAYESDTADAWGLDSNANPAIAANWSKLGNTQAVGVSTFNGRTGSVAPQAGDYITDQVTESLTKQFVTPTQKTDWTAKETTAGAQTKATAAQTAAKTYADSTFLPLTQKGAVSGVAPLGTDKRVPLVNLPAHLPQKARKWVDVKGSRLYNTWTDNASGGEIEIYIRTNALSDAAKYVIINMRENSSSGTFAFACTTDNATGNRYLAHQVTIPTGWQYAVQISGGAVASDINNIGVWRELRQ